jgi:hypothetical protein
MTRARHRGAPVDQATDARHVDEQVDGDHEDGQRRHGRGQHGLPDVEQPGRAARVVAADEVGHPLLEVEAPVEVAQ